MRHIKLLLFIAVVMLSGCNNSTKEDFLQQGIQSGIDGNHRGAMVLFKSALEKDPNFFEARFQLAETYLLTGKYDGAEKEFLKVQRQSPGYPKLPLRLAELYLRTQRAEQAIEVIAQYLEHQSEDANILDLLGRAYVAQGDLAEAEVLFRRSLKLNPLGTGSRLNLARLLMGRQDLEQARELLSTWRNLGMQSQTAGYLLADLEISQGDKGRALNIYRQLSEADPSAIKARYLAGFLLLDQGDLDSGARVAAELLQQFPRRAEGQRLQGVADYLAKDFEAATVHLLNSITVGPDLTAFYFLGLSYYNLGKLELALNQFQKILDYRSTFVQARIMVAMTLLKQKRVDDAISEVKKALNAAPERALAHNVLGSAYLAKERFDEAMEAFDRAIELDPELASAHLNKGLFSLSRGDSDKAETELVSALDVAPEVLNTRLLLSALYFRQQNYSQSILTLREGLSGRSEDALIYNNLAAVFFAQQAPVEAISALALAKKTKPDYFAPYFNLAAHHASRNDYDLAIAEYQAVLQIDPQNIKALLATATLLELQGDDPAALSILEKTKKLGALNGFIALSHYLGRHNRVADSLGVVELALVEHKSNPDLLEMKGKLLALSGRTSEAAEVLLTLEDVQPGRGLPILIATYLKVGAVAEAKALSDQVIHKDPASPYGYRLLATVYEGQQEFEQAMLTLKKGLGSVRDLLPLQVHLAKLYGRTGDFDSAIRTYRRIEQDHPSYYAATFSLGAIYDRRGDKKEALRCYEDVYSRAPNFTPNLNNLAYLYAENYSNLEKALELATRAYQNRPSDPGIMDTLGYVLLKKGKLFEAQALLERAALLLPNSPTVSYHLALVYEKSGNKAKAITLLRKAGSSEGFPELEQAQALLAKISG